MILPYMGDTGSQQRIAGYEIERRLGQGGMGTVYLARDPELGRHVALKLIQAELDSTEARDRFAKEARSIAALNHPNIVTLYHSGQFESRPYLVLEYIEGRSVASIVKTREPVPLHVRLRWLEELCDGLQFAHDRGVIHRDIKPANLMIDHLDRLRILDFGIARIAGGVRTEYSGLMGTPAYMAPEYMRGDEADHRADIFAAGAVAYELLSFQPAFPGQTHVTIMHRVMECAPAPFIEVGAVDVDPQLEQVVLGALRKNPHERYQSAREFRDAIHAVRARTEPGAQTWVGTAGMAAGTADSVGVDHTWLVPGREGADAAHMVQAEPTLDAAHSVIGALVARTNDRSAGQPEQSSGPGTGTESANKDSSWAEPAPRPNRRRHAAIAAGVIAVPAAAFALFAYLSSPDPSLRQPELRNEAAPASVTETLESPPTGVSAPRNPVDTGVTDKTAVNPSQPASAPASRPEAPPVTASGSPIPLPPPPVAGAAPIVNNSVIDVSAKNLFDSAGTPGRSAGGASNPGLLYRVLRQSDDGRPVGVDPDTTTFRTGRDWVRFAFQPNVDGYLYVAQEGTNGRWDVLFPDPNINGGRN
jgi:serine/threonine-protein kinase